jgi:hypothetical protein
MTATMSEQSAIPLGHVFADGERRRDAVHIAIAPVTAAEILNPGVHVGFVPEGQTETVGQLSDPPKVRRDRGPVPPQAGGEG